MNFSTMDTPSTRAEFEHRFHLLHNKLQQGKMHVAAHISMEGVLKVRKLPNGRIDFLSVNESARLQANMMLQMQGVDFESLKNQTE